MNTTDTKTDLQTYIDSLGFTYLATFRPTPQPGEKSPQLHWLITLERGKERMTFDYRQGMAHIPNYKQYFKTRHERRVAEGAYRRTCETGKLYSERTGYEIAGPFTTQPAPKLLDVLYCLVSDASVRHSAFYEEWAAEYGYDPDSRKGEETYRACQKQTMDFLRVLSAGKVGRGSMDTLETLETLYQNY